MSQKYNFTATIDELKKLMANENNPSILLRLHMVILILDAIQRDYVDPLEIILHTH